jgi:hypothetical protein
MGNGLMNNRWPRIYPVGGGESTYGGKDTLWIEFEILRIEHQNFDVREKGGISVFETGEKFYLLAPNEFGLNVSHRWGDDKNIGARLLEKVVHLKHETKEIKAVYKSIDNLLSNSGATSLKAGLAGAKIHDFQRVDAPMMYTDSEHRTYIFDFIFADQGKIYEDVYQPIDMLQRYSSAVDIDQTIKIELPHIFKIRTVDGNNQTKNIINVDRAAVTSMQPVFKGPYRDGYPTQATLSITFVDLSPLFASQWGPGRNRVNVTETSKRDSSNAHETLPVRTNGEYGVKK